MNHQTIISFILLSFSLFSNAQETLKDISNQKTENHINIPGTRLFIIPPKGFTIAKSFIGLQKGEDVGIQVYDLDGGNFYSNARSINRKKFEDYGLKVYDYSEFHLNTYPAKYLYVQGSALIHSHQLTFGDSTFSVMLMTVFPPGDKEMAEQLKTALLSVYYDPSFKVDPFATAHFTIDESVTRYKFSMYSSNLYAYTPDGKKNDDKFSPLVTITQLPLEQGSTFETIAESVIKGINQNSFILIENISATQKTINGFEAYEKIIKGYFNRKKARFYYLIFKQEERCIVFCGMSYAEDDNDLNDFKTFAKTIKLK